MADEPLRPATREELILGLAYALRFDGRRHHHKADDLMAQIAAEHLADYLDRARFVVMKREIAPDPARSTCSRPGNKA